MQLVLVSLLRIHSQVSQPKTLGARLGCCCAQSVGYTHVSEVPH